MSGETTDAELAEAIRNYGYRRCKSCGRVWTQLDAKLNWLLCCGMPLEEAVIPVPLATYEALLRAVEVR